MAGRTSTRWMSSASRFFFFFFILHERKVGAVSAREVGGVGEMSDRCLGLPVSCQ